MQTINDKAYSEAIDKLQRKVISGEISHDEYEEGYETLREKWINDESVNIRTNHILNLK